VGCKFECVNAQIPDVDHADIVQVGRHNSKPGMKSEMQAYPRNEISTPWIFLRTCRTCWATSRTWMTP
jgi:hypothetical protein